jgi:gliding motility-associated-like protein
MKQIFTKNIALFLFFISSFFSAKAQMEVCVSVAKDSLVFAYKAKKDYTVAPVNFWNSQLLTVRYPSNIKLTWGSIEQLSSFEWEEDPATPGIGADGGDGFIYKTFYTANTPTQSFKKDILVKVFKVKFTANESFTYEAITNTPYTQKQHLDAAVNNAVEPGVSNDGNIFSAFIDCGPIKYTKDDIPTDDDGDGFTSLTDPDDKNPCVPKSVFLANVVATDMSDCAVKNGKITITASGNDTLFYSINNGKTFSKSNIFTNLDKGTYQIVVKNKFGCLKIYSTTTTIKCTVPTDNDGDGYTSVTDPDDNDPCVPKSVTLSNVTVADMSDCATKNGKITITATGNDTLFYSIDNGKNFVKSNIFSNLGSGTYKVVVKNKYGCIKTSANNTIIKCDSSICTDKTAPTFVLKHAILKNKKSGDTLTTQCGYEIPLRENIEVSATDNIDKNVVVKLDKETLIVSPACFNGNKMILKWNYTAIDKCKNKSNFLIYVLIKDSIPPKLVGVPKNINITDKIFIPKPPVVTAEDKCDSDLNVVFEEEKIGDSLIIRKWSSSDWCGNFVSATQKIKIKKITTSPDIIELVMYEGETMNVDIAANDLQGGIVKTDVLRQEVQNNTVEFQTRFFNNSDVEIFARQVGKESITYGRYDSATTCDTLHVRVTVKKRQEEEVIGDDIIVYTAFSPNNDAVNETFTILNIEKYGDNNVSVFNRWGNEVFDGDNYKNDWNGTWRNKPLPDGTYFYIIKFTSRETLSGFVQIQR